MSESILGLENKVVVVTGSSQGIGLGCARQFARAGADVFVAGTAIFAAQNRDYAGAIEGLRQAARS